MEADKHWTSFINERGITAHVFVPEDGEEYNTHFNYNCS